MLLWNCCLIKTCCLVITQENSFWCNLRSILVTRQFGGANSSKASQVCHIMVYGSNYLKKHWQKIHFFEKKTWKHDDYTIIMVWIMTTMPRNMAAMSSSWHDHDHVSPWSWYDHGKIMTWQPCFSNPVTYRSRIIGKCVSIIDVALEWINMDFVQTVIPLESSV